MALKWRLAWTLILLLVGLGVAIAWAGRYASQLYFQEVNQTLNASLSMYVVERLTLIEDGTVNRDAFMTLADRAMTVNPSVEVYLLDVHGRVVAHAMPEGSILHPSVPLQPVTAFMEGDGSRLVLGQDPRSDSRKAFSASPILHGENLQGYLYVILGGQLFDQVQASFLNTFIGRMAASSLLVVLVLGGLAGVVALHRTTRPLERLQRAVKQYTDSGFVDDSAIRAVPDNTLEVRELKGQVAQLTERLARQFKEIEANDRLRRELVANVSHDLRTPLASMQGYLETLLIKDGELTAEQRRSYVDIAHRHTHRLNRMVADLFELAKLDSGALRPALEPFPVAELLHDVMQEFELSARDRGVGLVVDGLEQFSDLRVVADISLIERVVENLISNALRHTPRGGEVALTVTPGDGVVGIEVRDTGSGIAPELLPTIFDRYATTAAGDTERTGLGLAIVKKILELHEREIQVRSRPQRGTAFTFELPAPA